MGDVVPVRCRGRGRRGSDTVYERSRSVNRCDKGDGPYGTDGEPDHLMSLDGV